MQTLTGTEQEIGSMSVTHGGHRKVSEDPKFNITHSGHGPQSEGLSFLLGP